MSQQIGAFQDCLETVSAVEVGLFLEPSVDLPTKQAIAIEGRIVIARRRPESPLAIGRNDLRSDLPPMSVRLKTGYLNSRAFKNKTHCQVVTRSIEESYDLFGLDYSSPAKRPVSLM